MDMKTSKKSLMAMLLALPMLFGSCLNTSKSEPDPMAPGVLIYNAANSKHQLALVPTDAAIRLNMLLEEAKSQGLTGDEMLRVKNAEGKELRYTLFDQYSVLITREDTKYTLQFADGTTYMYNGKIIVDTNGFETLDTPDENDYAEWTVSTKDLYYKYPSLGGYINYYFEDDKPATVISGGNSGSYHIRINGLKVASGGSAEMLSGWNGDFTLNAPAYSLAYSKCHEGTFKLNGTGKDTYVSWDGQNVQFKGVTNSYYGDLIGNAILSGSITARFLSTDYDQTAYPSPMVQVIWSNDGKSYTINYNGMTSTY